MGKWHEVSQGISRFHIGKRFFNQMVAGHWNLMEMVKAPSLTVKKHLDKTFGCMVCFLGLSSEGPGDGFDDDGWSLPTQGILWF